MATVLERPDTTRDVRAADDPPHIRLITVNEYDRIGEAGIFSPGERIELLGGRIIRMSPKGRRHAAATDRAAKLFIGLLGDRVITRNQNPILLTDLSEPEPDIVLAAPQEKEYADRLPQPADVLLLLEVADTSLEFDRGEKSLAYARAGIIQYLVLNLKTGELIDFREPSPEGYRSYKTLHADDSFTLVAFPEVEIKVGDLLPPE